MAHFQEAARALEDLEDAVYRLEFEYYRPLYEEFHKHTWLVCDRKEYQDFYKSQRSKDEDVLTPYMDAVEHHLRYKDRTGPSIFWSGNK
jgi:hypothetical protein